MKPTKKSEEIENLIASITGSDRRETIRQNRCIPPPIGCGKPAMKEFTISGLCQECQDSIFS